MSVTILRPSTRVLVPGVTVLSARPAAGGGAFSGVLDGISNVAAAYSLRRLSSSYSGSAVRVRRSSDSTEQDIGFDANGDFDSSAFSSFVGGGTGYARTWYDQSGNGRDAAQATAGNQPVVTTSAINGKSTITNSSGTQLFTPSMPHFPSRRGGIIVVTQQTSPGDIAILATYNAAATSFIMYSSAFGYKWYDGAAHNYSSGGDSVGTTYIHSISRYGDTAAKYWRTGALNATWSIINNQPSDNELYIGSLTNGSQSFWGHIAALIEFSADIPATDHNTIGNNMATYYGLSWTTVT